MPQVGISPDTYLALVIRQQAYEASVNRSLRKQRELLVVQIGLLVIWIVLQGLSLWSRYHS